MYAADIIGCPWACRRCWSGYGTTGADQAKRLSPEEVVARLLRGLERHRLREAKISGGEPSLHPEHLVALGDEWVTRAPAGAVLTIETNALGITDDVVDRLVGIRARICPSRNAPHASPVDPLRLHVTLKALDAPNAVWLAGASPAEFEQVMSNVEYLAKSPLDLSLDLVTAALVDEEQVELFIALLNLWREGLGDELMPQKLRTYFPRRREVDERAGERRVRAAREAGWLDEEGMTEDELRDHRLSE